MTGLLLLSVTVLFDLSQARFLNAALYRHAFDRLPRNINPGETGSSFEGIQNTLVHECELNFQSPEKQDALNTSVIEMQECFKTKKKFEVSKEEYIQHLENCTQDTRDNWKACLNESQQYIPDMMMETDKEIVLYEYARKDLYENKTAKEEIINCFKLINTNETISKRSQCLAAIEGYDPQNKKDATREQYCSYMASYGQCYREFFEPCVTDFKAIVQHREDFLDFTWKPCSSKETIKETAI